MLTYASPTESPKVIKHPKVMSGGPQFTVHCIKYHLNIVALGKALTKVGVNLQIWTGPWLPIGKVNFCIGVNHQDLENAIRMPRSL